jgi:predicted alpha/beta-fold hydrolase
MEGKNKGRTREILAIGAGLGGLAVIGYLALNGNEMAVGSLVSVVSGVFSFYFAAKTAER